jgi:hypothetical protein
MTMTIPRNSVGFSELLDHAQQESHRWHDWFNQHSLALDVKIDVAGSATVRDLLSHIVLATVRRSPLGETLGRERMHFTLEVAIDKYLAYLATDRTT